ncbi:MAG: ABC transporter ATP-binding protein [Sporolactobacillus sp.]
MTPILKVENLTKTINQFRLNALSFTVQEGCITGFIGKNGAGKTTTIKSLLGIYPMDSGRILFRGKDMMKNSRMAMNEIGVVMDQGYFYEHLTLNEMKNILAPSYSHWDEVAFSEWVERFQLDKHQKIEQLSRGMRIKYALALALSHHADLLIMDEPTSGLDPIMRSELMTILRAFMNEEGKSVFFSTHITSDLDKIADQIILIDQGRLLFGEEKDSLLDSHIIVKGDNRWINSETRSLFIKLNQSSYGFDGLSQQREVIQRLMPEAIIERPTIEDIMLAYVKGEEDHVTQSR